MNDRRTPVTKLFDTIRSHYTALENEVDPAKKGTIPAQLQEFRNSYAAKKREEEERRRQETLRAQRQEQARSRYTADVEASYTDQFNSHLTAELNSMRNLFAEATLETIDLDVEPMIKKWSTEPKESFFINLRPRVAFPAELTLDEAEHIGNSVRCRMRQQMCDTFKREIEACRDNLLQLLPSKREQLRRAAQASAEEAERIRKEMAEREAAEAARQEQERKEKEDKAKAEAEVAAKRQQMDDLFAGAQADVRSYLPKTSVKLRLEVLTPEGFMEVLGLWWSQKGCTMTVEELEKEFKKQITFCTKLANDKNNPIQISGSNVRYVEDVKAK